MITSDAARFQVPKAPVAEQDEGAEPVEAPKAPFADPKEGEVIA